MNRVLVIIILSAALLASTGAARAECPAGAECIGSEALTEFPESGLWNKAVNFLPEDGKKVDINPPRFSWTYTPIPANVAADTKAYLFIFQVCKNQDFQNPDLAVNVLTRLNLYNLIAPFDARAQQVYYWRVGYIVDTRMDSSAANGMPDGVTSSTDADKIAALQPLANWSATRSFIIADNTPRWDRSMLANPEYLAQKGAHPHMLFNNEPNNPKNGAALYGWLETNGGAAWSNAKAQADKNIALAWWNDADPTLSGVNIDTWCPAIENVAFVWQMTRNAAVGTADQLLSVRLRNKNPQNALVNLADYYTRNAGDHKDVVGGISRGVIQTLGLGYDWLYELMTPDQRNLVASAIGLNCKYLTRGGVLWWQSKNNAIGNGYGDPTGVYAGPYIVMSYAMVKNGTSHNNANFWPAMFAALSAYADNASARELFDLGINYIIGKAYWAEGMNQGKLYAIQGFFTSYRALYVAILSQIAFPEAQFNRNPFYRSAANWWSRMMPVGFVQGHEPWGDVGWGKFEMWRLNTMGRDLAYFTGDGMALKHWKEEDAIARYHDSLNIEELPIPFYFTPPAEKDNDSSTAQFVNQGWAMAATYPSNTKECYKDGVGFVFQARPGGSVGHAHFSDLSFQIWAYGSLITDASGGYGGNTPYPKVPMAHYSLLVNGIGTAQPGSQNQPFYSRIIASEEKPGYAYVAADATRAYPRMSFQAGVGDGYCSSFARTYSGGKLFSLKKAQRHMLFVHRKYFVIFDVLENETPAKFTWLYHVLENNLKMDMANPGSFSYTSNLANYLGNTDGSDVIVKVAHIYQPQNLEVYHLTGKKVASNPFTGEDYYDSLESHHRAHTVWASNIFPREKFNFMTVIYPIKPRSVEPEITRLDDFTVRVADADGTEVITFNPAAPQGHQATIAVDLANMASRPVNGVSDDEVGLVVNMAGNDSGWVRFSDSGYTCFSESSNACGNRYPRGTQVALTAGRSNWGSSFAGWTGACAGSANPCTVTLNEAKTVTATFNTNPSYHGAVKIMLVGPDGTPATAPAGAASKIDNGDIVSGCSVDNASVLGGFHTFYAANLTGYKTYYATCAYNAIAGAQECANGFFMTSGEYNPDFTCDAEFCGLKTFVPDNPLPWDPAKYNWTRKVVFKYVPDTGTGKMNYGDLSADGSITAYDAALALQLGRGALEAAEIAQRAVNLG